MDAIDRTIAKLSKLKTAAEFHAIIPELQDHLASVRLQTDDLRDALEDALFASPDEVEGIRSKIALNQSRYETIQIAITGAARKKLQAAAHEAAADLERRSQVAKGIQAALLKDYIELDRHLAAASDLLVTVRNHEESLKSFNELVLRQNRQDLLVRSPWWHLGRIIEKDGGGDSIPGLGAFANQYPVTGVLIRGYFPERPKSGPALARMKEVKLP